jgi:hypothetical protein
MCLLTFKSRNEYINHIQSKHLKSLIINTDKGNTVAFSRVGPSKFVCPTCYSGCENIQDVLFHLLCEESLESEFETSSRLNESTSIETENGNSSAFDSYDFLLTSSYQPNLNNVKNKDENLNTNEYDISSSSEMYKSQKLFNNNKYFTNYPESERKIINVKICQSKFLSNKIRSGSYRLRLDSIEYELKKNPTLRLMFEIVYRYLNSKKASYTIANSLYNLGPNESMALNTIINFASSKKRLDKQSQSRLVEELVASNLFSIIRPIYDTSSSSADSILNGIAGKINYLLKLIPYFFFLFS